MGDLGFGVYENQFSTDEVSEIIRDLDAETSIRGGRRNLLDDPGVTKVIRAEPIRRLVAAYLTESAVCVRGILFDKTQANNWNLPFHQDTKIAIKCTGEASGYTQFSEKDGVIHVSPPAEILSRQIAVRIQLDPCWAESGPVRIVPDSDRHGILSQLQISEALKQSSPIDCTGGVGSVLVFRSLLLHGSDRSKSTERRRVLHLEFCDAQLAPPLKWKWAIPICR